MFKLLLFLMWLPLTAFSATKEIIFWHSMAGQLGDEVVRIAQQFNDSQTAYTVKPIYKGDYTESLTSFAAAFRAKQPPNLIQVSEVGISVMRLPKGIIKPVDVLMSEQGMAIPKAQFFSAVLDHYSDQGQLMAMPFNVSIPVMFYDADALAKFGISPKTFPKTWNSLELLAKQLHEAGFECAYTTAYPSWILIESYLALQGLTAASGDLTSYHHKPIASHLKRMRRWQNLQYFEYGGRVDDATVLFTSKKCPLFSQSSGGYASLSELTSFRLGVAPMPLDTQIATTRHNNTVGGAAIWVVAGQSSDIEHGVALFLAFLSQKGIQQAWYEHTGYLPLGDRLQQTPSHGNASLLEIAAFDLDNDHGIKLVSLGPQNQIRAINDQMLEAIFSGMMGTDEAMDRAETRINHVIQRFRENTTY